MLLGRLGLGQVGRREFHCRFRLHARAAVRGGFDTTWVSNPPMTGIVRASNVGETAA
jgi:hypothetical protein